jgi:hypothetical protein
MRSEKTDESAAVPTNRGGWQFSLKDLFGLMTYAAAASGLVVWFGPGTLMTSIGLLIAILNVRGVFARLQRGRTQWVLLIIAWGVFLVSLALPCVSVGAGYAWGVQAAWMYLASTFELLVYQEGMEFGPHLFWVVAIDLANLLMAALPILLWRLSRQCGQWFAATLCVAMTSAWVTNWKGDLLVGFYLWCVSFQLALVAIPLTRKTFAAMFGYGLLMIGIVCWYDIV